MMRRQRKANSEMERYSRFRTAATSDGGSDCGNGNDEPALVKCGERSGR